MLLKHILVIVKILNSLKELDGTIEIKIKDGFENITGVPESKLNDKSLSAISDIKESFDQVKGKTMNRVKYLGFTMQLLEDSLILMDLNVGLIKKMMD